MPATSPPSPSYPPLEPEPDDEQAALVSDTPEQPGWLRWDDEHLRKRKRKRIFIAAFAFSILLFIVFAASTNRTRLRNILSPNSQHKNGFGSTITTENGTTFKYQNKFGGFWVADPLDNSAKPQSTTPALNERWDYSTDLIHGVNLGGWLTLEPFITPGLFQPFEHDKEPAVDEWTLCQKLGANMSTVIINHYETFITERDFADIASAGLNWVRIPLPFWAIETQGEEPFLEGVCWKYFLRAITWARKYGLRINVDLHSVPGSQNGWNHSGKYGNINFLMGPMGIANAQRTLNYIRTLIEFVSRPEYAPVIPMVGIVNEVLVSVIGTTPARQFYLEAYKLVRDITGIGEGKGPMISFHDGFRGQWRVAGFLKGSDRIALETHSYLAFYRLNDDPMSLQIPKPCKMWSSGYNNSMQQFGFTFSGEWSLAINDCGTYVNGVGAGSHYEGSYDNGKVFGSCQPWNDFQSWNSTLKQQFQQFALAQMDSARNWFFWTWKIGPSLNSTAPVNPFWSYSLALQNGFMPLNPRDSRGACFDLPVLLNYKAPPSAPFEGPLSAWQTGGEGAGTIVPEQLSSYGQWPPTSLTDFTQATLLPTLTPTGTPKTLAPLPSTSLQWANPANSKGYYVQASNCRYQDPWDPTDSPISPACSPVSNAAQITQGVT